MSIIQYPGDVTSDLLPNTWLSPGLDGRINIVVGCTYKPDEDKTVVEVRTATEEDFKERMGYAAEAPRAGQLRRSDQVSAMQRTGRSKKQTKAKKSRGSTRH